MGFSREMDCDVNSLGKLVIELEFTEKECGFKKLRHRDLIVGLRVSLKVWNWDLEMYSAAMMGFGGSSIGFGGWGFSTVKGF